MSKDNQITEELTFSCVEIIGAPQSFVCDCYCLCMYTMRPYSISLLYNKEKSILGDHLYIRI